ncbi:MAG: ATP-dependent Clp protease adapter ClpS [Desulfobacterales bacterium]|nr:ATP-dependent Clp protease adapter ClpS [Desulfobacterales bacterium]
MGTSDTGVIEKVKQDFKEKLKEPSMYKVLLHNDDYTTMDFVIEILIYIFHKTHDEATGIMLNVHEKGVGICGIYTFEVAETKVETVHRLAKENEFPLKCSMEGV